MLSESHSEFMDIHICHFFTISEIKLVLQFKWKWNIGNRNVQTGIKSCKILNRTMDRINLIKFIYNEFSIPVLPRLPKNVCFFLFDFCQHLYLIIYDYKFLPYF